MLSLAVLHYIVSFDRTNTGKTAIWPEKGALFYSAHRYLLSNLVILRLSVPGIA